MTNKHDLVDSSLFPQPTTSRRLRRFDWIHIKKQNDIKRQSNQHTVNKKKKLFNYDACFVVSFYVKTGVRNLRPADGVQIKGGGSIALHPILQLRWPSGIERLSLELQTRV